MFNKYKKLFEIIFFLIIIFIPIIALFNSGLPLTHDGQDHVARIANFYQNLTEGNLIPRWAPNLNWGYGHPILEFLYPLPSYIASFFHFVGLTLVDSVKVVFGLGMVLSFVFMYLWLSLFLGKYAALFGAVLYLYAPYRFVETYVRGDIGENLAFAFIPLVLYFFYKLYKKNNINDLIFGGLSVALLILSHNAISLMFMPIIIFYGLFLVYISKNRKSLIINLSFLIILGFSLSMFFWLPALFEGKFTLRNIVTAGGYLDRFVTIPSLIFGPWSYGGTGQFTVQLGIIQLLAFLVSPVIVYKHKVKKEKSYILIALLLAFSLLSIFLMLPISGFIWSRIILLQNFQFPWRFLAIPVFSLAVLGALVFDALKEKQKLVVLVICVVIILFLEKDYMKPKAYLIRPESFYSGIYNSTTDTGESAPIWSVRFMEKRPNAHLEVIDGTALIKELDRKSTYHKYLVKVSKTTLFKENTLYFPGWEIRANGTLLNIEFQNMSYRGIMLFSLNKGSYVVEVRQRETKLRAISDAISVVVLFNILGFLSIRFVKRKYS